MDLTLNPALSVGAQVELSLRLVAGLALGAIIGLERELHRQPAGFRTHSLVSLGAALFAIISGYGYGGAAIDPTRITAQIVSGIGFIGAGTILQYRGQVRGLTTAASLWSVAAIGTATGTGLYVMAALGTVLILVVLSLLDRVEDMARSRLEARAEGQTSAAEREAAADKMRPIGPSPEEAPPGGAGQPAPSRERERESEGHAEDLP